MFPDRVPLASMAAMRAIQPKMKALQEKLKDDKATLQRNDGPLPQGEGQLQFLRLYADFPADPGFLRALQGCSSSPSRCGTSRSRCGSRISAPDPLHILNLFGLLPFTPPAFLGIGILCDHPRHYDVVYSLSEPRRWTRRRSRSFALMPWIMMFVMALAFAAGLLIYWITSNLLTIAQQKWLDSRHPQPSSQRSLRSER